MSVEERSRDAELIDETARGDRAAFEELVSRHQAAVFRFARTIARSTPEAEDVLQETFLAAWRSAGSFRGESAVRSWLLTIARNATLRQQRRGAGEPEDHEPLEVLGARAGWGQEDDPEGLAIRRENREALRRAFESLPAGDREIVLLRDIEGFSGEETAAILQVGLTAMKSRLHRARLRMAAALRESRS
jgi:RNA polymerase sigma-70 factor, ECF subfamily